ncbi:MAG: heavy metal-binding domain-containing protein [Thermaerobacter sp.]|nr:heavy metal-binding domain-containing protein [Thermaerobacter sp.]
MPLFGGGGQSRSLQDVEQEIGGVDRRRGAFTSDLTAQEFWLLRSQGYTPVGLVMGNSVFSMGITGGIATALRGLARGELTEYTELMYDARQLALSRMKREADELGADGVVGVDFEVIHHGTDVMEVWAVGTAVKQTGQQMEAEGVKVVISTDSGGRTTARVEPLPMEAAVANARPMSKAGGDLATMLNMLDDLTNK